MKIVSVCAINFRSYSDINWNIRDSGLILIDGVNPGTGRSNAAGKSTLIDSIFWALFGYLPKWNGPKGGPLDAVIKRGCDSCNVKVVIEHLGQVYEIERQRPSKLKVTCDGQKVEGKVSDLDSRMSSFIGMNASQFLISVYMSQDRGTSFFSMGDNDRTQFLSVIAGLDNLNAALDKAKDERKKLELELSKIQGGMDVLHEQINAVPAQIKVAQTKAFEIEVKLKEIADKKQAAERSAIDTRNEAEEEYRIRVQSEEKRTAQQLAELQKEYESLGNNYKSLNNRLKECPQIDPSFKEKVREASELLAKAEAFNREANFTEMNNANKNEKIKDLLQLIESVKKGRCNSCSQNLPKDAIEAEELKIKQKIEHHRRSIEVVPERLDLGPLKEALDQAKEVETLERAKLDDMPNRLKLGMDDIYRKCDVIKEKSKSIQAASESSMRAFLNDKALKLREADASLYRINTFHEGIKRDFLDAQNQLRFHEMHTKSLNEKIETGKKRISTLNEQLDEVLDLVDLFGPKGLRVVYFDSIIERIGSRAGYLMSIMTDGMYSTRIDQIGENSKGEQKLILRPIITKGGIEVPQDDLSGGMKRTAMLAYDIAAAESVGESNVLFLDEALDGLDSGGKSEAILLLEEVARSRAVYLIDHTNEIRSSVQNIIKVTYQDGTSSIGSV